jgi:glycerol-3-phosphate dehydrogenase
MTTSETATDCDVLVIGGGVNGTGIARDAAGRGYRVVLAEMGDLASGTSSAATKLVHGGLRYLEHYEFRLVHEALVEREVLWASAPHIIRPMRFVLPYQRGLRPAWLLRLGLFVYDHLGGRKLLPPTRTIDLRTDPAGQPLKPGFHIGFEYSDGWVDDARLVALNARDAANRGARILTRTKAVEARRTGAGGWRVALEDEATGERETVTARLLVNAAGPWVDTVLAETVGENEPRHVRLVKGSHIVVRRLFEHDRAYFFQNADKRIFFAIPYEGDYTLLGTTDLDFNGDPHGVRISPAEISYLCAAASEYFARPVTADDIVWTYSGVRPLFDDGASAAQEATRDYVLRTEGDAARGALINVFGGKLTTSRRLSEQVVDRITRLFGERRARWTARAKLPGGEFPATGFAAFAEGVQRRYPWLEPGLARRLSRSYGTLVDEVLGAAGGKADLGEDFGAGLTAREVDYLIEREWARTPEDVLWRRSKLGLSIGEAGRARLATHMARRLEEGK